MSAAQSITPGWYSLKGAAVYTGFSDWTIRAAMGAGRLPVQRVAITGSGAKDAVRIRREHLDAWIEGREIPASDFTAAGEIHPPPIVHENSALEA